MHTGSEPVFSQNGLITTIAASAPGKIRYALEGSVFTAGAAVQWLRDEMKLIPDAAASEGCAQSVRDTGGVYVVPAFTGLGAPYWNQYARGTITGITRGFTRDQLIRATLESLAYQTFVICRAMESDAGVALTRLRVDGGASANDFLMQFQSNILGAEVLRPALHRDDRTWRGVSRGTCRGLLEGHCGHKAKSSNRPHLPPRNA